MATRITIENLYQTRALLLKAGEDRKLITITPNVGVSTGVTNFTSLLDTPPNYVGQSSKVLAVNVGETALEFIDVNLLIPDVSTIQADLTALTARVDAIDLDISTLQSGVSANASDITALDIRVTNVEAAGLIARMGAAETAIVSNDGDILTLQTDLDLAETNIATLTSDIAALTAMDTNAYTLLGVSKGNLDLGTFAGTTIGDNVTVKTALQQLELALEAIDVSPVGGNPVVIGVAGDDLGIFTGTVINDNVTIKVALQELETYIETTRSTQTSQGTAITNLTTLSGVVANSTHLGTFTGDVITDNVSVKAALQELETLLITVRDSGSTAEDIALRALTGTTLGDSDLGTFTGTLITDNTTIKTALQTLESAVELNTGDIFSLSTELSAVRTLSGTTEGVSNLGTFPGTIISDNADIKQALQELEASISSGDSLEVISLRTLTGTASAANTLGIFPGATISDNSSIKEALTELETAVESVSNGGLTPITVVTATTLAAAANGRYLFDAVSTGGNLTVTIPNGVVGRRFSIGFLNSAAHNIILKYAGQPIAGFAEDLILNKDNMVLVFEFIGGATGWKLIDGVGEGAGGGGGGTTIPPFQTRTGDFTVLSGQRYLVNNDTTPVTVSLPTAEAGDWFSLGTYAASSQTVTVVPAGTQNIMGLNEGFIYDQPFMVLTFDYIDDIVGWKITSGVGESAGAAAGGITITDQGVWQSPTTLIDTTFDVTLPPEMGEILASGWTVTNTGFAADAVQGTTFALYSGQSGQYANKAFRHRIPASNVAQTFVMRYKVLHDSSGAFSLRLFNLQGELVDNLVTRYGTTDTGSAYFEITEVIPPHKEEYILVGNFFTNSAAIADGGVYISKVQVTAYANSPTTYSTGDLVEHIGKFWVCYEDATTEEPSNGSDVWIESSVHKSSLFRGALGDTLPFTESYITYTFDEGFPTLFAPANTEGWTITSAYTDAYVDATTVLQSKAIADNTTTEFIINVTADRACDAVFRHTAVSDDFADLFEIYYREVGSGTWLFVGQSTGYYADFFDISTLSIPAAGNYEIKFSYTKDTSGSTGLDAGFLSAFMFPDFTVVPQVLTLDKLAANDIILFNGSYYQAMVDSPITNPSSTNINEWLLVSPDGPYRQVGDIVDGNLASSIDSWDEWIQATPFSSSIYEVRLPQSPKDGDEVGARDVRGIAHLRDVGVRAWSGSSTYTIEGRLLATPREYRRWKYNAATDNWVLIFTAQAPGAMPSGPIVENGSFSTGSLAGWTPVNGTEGVEYTATTSSTDGGDSLSAPTGYTHFMQFLVERNDATVASVIQTVSSQDIIDKYSMNLPQLQKAGATNIHFTWLSANLLSTANGNFTIRIKQYDSGGGLLVTTNTVSTNSSATSGTWKTDNIARAVLDPSAAYFEVEIESIAVAVSGRVTTHVCAAAVTGLDFTIG